MTISELAQALGISRPVAYSLAKNDELPVPVIRLGRRMVVSRAAVDALLGVEHTVTGNTSREVAGVA